MQAHRNTSLLQVDKHHISISSDALNDVVAGYGLHRNQRELAWYVVWNTVDHLGHLAVGDGKHGLPKSPEIFVAFT